MYGATKVWVEALGRHFSDAYVMSVLCMRIGSVCLQNHPTLPRQYSVYLSHRDVNHIRHKCIEASDELKYDTSFTTSDDKWSYRDIQHPREVLGFEPQDSAESFR